MASVHTHHPQTPHAWLSYQERFAQVAHQHSTRVALVDQHRVKSYHDLDQETSALSLALQERGASRDDLIVIYMPPSYEYVASCLAILKAGAAFLPVPVDLPASQVGLILEDAQPKVVLTSEAWAPTIHTLTPALSGTALSERVLVLSDQTLSELTRTYDPAQPEAVRPSQPQDLAFATYTSGTTGKPKGVLQVQSALVASYDARHRFNPYGEGERVACHVFFMWEILRPLLVGATTVVIPDELIAMPKRLVSFLKSQEVTEVLFTPSAFQRVIRSLPAEELCEGLSGLRTIWLNGEVVTTKLVQEALASLPPTLKLLNTYSICECHDVSNANLKTLPLDELTAHHGGLCPVGHADEGVVVRVMTADGLKAEGEGELYIGGHGLGPGYLHLNALTQERFPEVEGARYYATGDLSQLSAEGLITIKGRLGTMVKLRGYSVYLNSIEEALRLHPQVLDARVFLRGEHLSQHLTAFVVGQQSALAEWMEEESQSAPQLQAWLTKHLPAYAIPSVWVRVEQLPVHPISGKLDQEALWALERAELPSLEELKGAPQESWEECQALMRALWARALEVDLTRVKLESDFYALGGHSLSMVDLVMSVEETFGVRLEGDELYERPTLEGFMMRALKDHPTHPNTSDLTPDLTSTQAHDEPFWTPQDLSLMWPVHTLLSQASLNTIEMSTTETSTTERVKLSEARAVLLTGATGHLGLGLLEGLLTRLPSQSKVYCLVRPSEGRSGLERLSQLYKNAQLSKDEALSDPARVEVIEGDICHPQLGLSAEHYDQLSAEVELIFHCAAFVNLRARYEQMRPSIVEGTRHILHFAATKRLKTLHHVSTNSVLAGEERSFSEESAERFTGAPLIDGYSQAKWVAERLVEQATAQGLPTTVYRPGNIGPHRVTGYMNPNDLMSVLLRACVSAHEAPIDTQWALELTPVDVTAELMLSIAELASPQPRYHLVHPHSVALDALFDELSEKLRAQSLSKVERRDWRAWREVLLASGEPTLRVLASSLPYFTEQLSAQPCYALDHLKADLPEQARYFEQPLEPHALLKGLWSSLAPSALQLS